jgi:plasmid stabilization system protein ParE
MPRLILHQDADDDIHRISDYIATDSVDTAIRFFRAARKACGFLAEFPGAGGTHPTASYPGLRAWPITGFRNYLVCYLPLADGAEVLRVIHAAQDLDREFR